MKITPTTTSNVITFSDKSNKRNNDTVYKWWRAKDKKELLDQFLSTAVFLKENQNYRQRQAGIFAKLYGNQNLFSFIGSSAAKMDATTGFPADRPTFNLIQSCVDTLVSRIGQNRPSPRFLTDGGDYKERNLAKKLDNFIVGELYQTKAYEKVPLILKDALVEGKGCLKVYEGEDNKVKIERVLLTELFVDLSEAMYGEPRQLYQLKLIDRAVLKEMFPGMKSEIEVASPGYPDSSTNASKSISDMIMVVEGWRLADGPNKEGRHVIACSAGILSDETWDKPKFPFIFLDYSERLLGFWSQGLAEQLMGTQMEINSLLYTISRAMKIVGVPRVFVEDGSKVVKAHFNNDVGSIVTYRGTKPTFEVAPCVPPEMYEQLQRLVGYGYQQCGVSALQATSEKPAGLNSGEAIRSYDDISSDRFQNLSRKYDNFFIELAYMIIDTAKDIAEREGAYATIFQNKNGIKEIELPKLDLLKNPYIIQCFNTSSLPREPAGRLQKVTEMIQSGMITIKEGRRMLDFPDIDQIERLANAREERIFQILDEIVEEGKYTPPDPFTDLDLGTQHTVDYINLYSQCALEEEKMDMLRDFFKQCQALKQAAMPPAMPAAPGAIPPQAQPMAQPQSPLVPNVNQG